MVRFQPGAHVKIKLTVKTSQAAWKITINVDIFEKLLFIVIFLGFADTILIPILDLFLIFIFFIKIFSKNKTKKDWIIIILNLISIIIYAFISFLLVFIMFVSDRVRF